MNAGNIDANSSNTRALIESYLASIPVPPDFISAKSVKDVVPVPISFPTQIVEKTFYLPMIESQVRKNNSSLRFILKCYIR